MGSERRGGARREAPDWIVLGLACVAQFMVILDVSVVNVALPSIGRDLHYSPTGLQWVVNAYVLTFAGFLLLGGRAADLFGRRKLFLFGLALFTAASLVGGFAQDTTWLTAARAVQGIGGAALSPATLTIIVTSFSGRSLAKALGLWGAMGGAGGAAGVLLGGILTAELSWRWVLFINIPLGIATAAVAVVFLGEAKGMGKDKRLDVLGAVLVTAGLAAVIYAIVGTDEHPWGSATTISWLAAGAVLLGLFAFVQAKTREPLVPFTLFRHRSLVGANIVMLMVGAAFFSMWYFLSLYLQDVLRYGPLRAGLAFLPMGIVIMIGAQGASRLLPRIGVRPLLFAGTVMATGGYAWLAMLHSGSTYWASVFGPGCLISFALGVLFTPLAAAATSSVGPAEAGLASGVLNTSRQVGGSLGLAILATLASSRTNDLIHAGAATGAALTDGFARAFAGACACTAVAFMASWVVPAAARAGTHAPAPAPGTAPVETAPVETAPVAD